MGQSNHGHPYGRAALPVIAIAGESHTELFQLVRQLYVSTGTDAPLRPYTACERSPVATIPGFRRRLSGMPGLQSLYQGQGDWAKPGHRAARCSATSPSRLDVHFSSQRSLRAEKAVGRTGLRNHQGATGGTEVPAARPRQRGGRVDHVGHNLQPAHSLSGVEFPALLQPSVSRSEALSCLVN